MDYAQLNMNINVLQEEIEKLNKLPRNHADYFNWHDKEIQEIGIGLHFFQKLEEISEEYLVEIKNAEDPPDVKVVTNTGKTIGIEITELVDQKAIEYKIKNDSRYAGRVVGWNKENTINATTNIITKKDYLCGKVPNTYDTLVLLIFTDEPKLPSDTLKKYFEGHNWPETKSFDKVYVLTGYEPQHGTKHLLRLK